MPSVKLTQQEWLRIAARALTQMSVKEILAFRDRKPEALRAFYSQMAEAVKRFLWRDRQGNYYRLSLAPRGRQAGAR